MSPRRRESAKVKGHYGLTPVAADFDGDGWPDIFVACDSTSQLAVDEQSRRHFSRGGLERGVGLNDDGVEQAGMGVGIGDYNLDGHLDLFKGPFSPATRTVLYRNDGKGNFSDVTLSSGLGVETRYTVGARASSISITMAFPIYFSLPAASIRRSKGKCPAIRLRRRRLIFRNLGNGKFEELIENAGPGVAAAHSSRGCAFGDFDNDGDLDILIVNLNEPPSLLRNDITGDRHWLKVKLIGTQSNRSAIGAAWSPATVANGRFKK